MSASVEPITLPARRPGMPHSYLLIIAAAITAVALGLVIAAIALRPNDASYPPGSPQRAVQTYLGLLQSGKVDRAYAMTDLSPAVYVDTSLAGFHQQWDQWSTRSHRVTLVRADRTGNSASVTVDITAFSASPLGSNENTQRVTFTLARERGSWKITGPSALYIP